MTILRIKPLLSSNYNPTVASKTLQSQHTLLETWSKTWGIKFNPSKCTHIPFPLRRASCATVVLYNTPLPVADIVEYLGLYSDGRLTWNFHIKLKRQQLNQLFKMLHRILDKRSHLSLTNKPLIYNTILELWATSQPSNLTAKIIYAPCYFSNLTLHTDLYVPFVKDLVRTK